MYHVTYAETEHTALIDLPAIRQLPPIEATLEDVADNCELYHCEAVVRPMTSHLYKEIVRLGAEAQAHPILAVQRARQIAVLYTAIASLKARRV